MIEELSHIGIAVKDIDQYVIKFASVFGLEPPEVKDFPERSMKMATISVGQVVFEILEDYSSEGFIARSVRKNGSGLHHIGLVSGDIEKDMEVMQARGVDFIGDKPAVGLRGKKIAFASEDNIAGFLFELSER